MVETYNCMYTQNIIKILYICVPVHKERSLNITLSLQAQFAINPF